MLGFAEMKRFEKSVLSGEIDNPYAKQSLENGAQIHGRGIFLCQHCKEFRNSNVYYLHENFREPKTPYGPIIYDVSFPFGKPICNVCNNEMTYIKNVRSIKTKCPKCNGELKARLSAYVD